MMVDLDPKLSLPIRQLKQFIPNQSEIISNGDYQPNFN
jgi:hypothetical protein